MAAVKKPASGAAPKQKRRSPITRAEGEQRLIDAAIVLLQERPFGEVGVREIAAKADVNHGFVHTWFGGKGPLMERVATVLLERVSESVRSTPPGSLAAQPFDPNVQLAVRLVMWLTLENGVPPVIRNQAVIKALAERYVTVEGMAPETARLAAQQAVAIAIATVMYGPLIDIDSNDAASQTLGLWRHIVGLLAKHPPA
jgi:AcrR family transcriptional regulator